SNNPFWSVPLRSLVAAGRQSGSRINATTQSRKVASSTRQPGAGAPRSESPLLKQSVNERCLVFIVVLIPFKSDASGPNQLSRFCKFFGALRLVAAFRLPRLVGEAEPRSATRRNHSCVRRRQVAS